MRDIHSHVLPSVDDGARDLAASLEMIGAARAAGVTEIVCTPHCRDPFFDFDAMWGSFHLLSSQVVDVKLTMGFEVAHAKLVSLGVEAWAPKLHFDGSDELLLELDPGCTEADFIEYDRTIHTLQGMGYTVIIAHPERYRAVQRNIDLAVRLVRMGCELQASSDFLAGGRFGKEKKPARKMFDRLLYRHIASDAHVPEHYELLRRACDLYPVRGAHAQLPG